MLYSPDSDHFVFILFFSIEEMKYFKDILLKGECNGHQLAVLPSLHDLEIRVRSVRGDQRGAGSIQAAVAIFVRLFAIDKSVHVFVRWEMVL